MNSNTLETIEVGSWQWIIDNKESSITVVTYDIKVNQVKTMIEEKNLNISLINGYRNVFYGN